MQKLYIHIGLHKTGTSFLQKAVFPILQNTRTMLGWDSLRSFLNLSSSPAKNILVSDESLCGQFDGGRWMEEFEDQVERIKSLVKVHGVIIGFRRHDELILSLYKQHLQKGGRLRMNEFYMPNSPVSRMRDGDLLFKKRLAVLHKNFDSVFVYTQEELRDEFKKFTVRFSNFIHCPIPEPKRISIRGRNVGLSGSWQANLLRKLNSLDGRFQGHPFTVGKRLLRRAKMDPRSICQYHLRFVRCKPLALPAATQEHLLHNFSSDWDYIQSQMDHSELLRDNGR